MYVVSEVTCFHCRKPLWNNSWVKGNEGLKLKSKVKKNINFLVVYKKKL